MSFQNPNVLVHSYVVDSAHEYVVGICTIINLHLSLLEMPLHCCPDYAGYCIYHVQCVN